MSTHKIVSAGLTPSAPRARIEGGQNGKVRITHRVRSGETLWSIARRYNVYVHQLRQWNLLEVSDILKLGQRIQVWTKPSPMAALEDRSPG